MGSLNIIRLRDRAARPNGQLTGAADCSPLLGTWVNYDQLSTGIRRVELRLRDGALCLGVQGSGDRPEGTGWPWVPAWAFSAGVDAYPAVGFAASCELEFAHVLIAAYLNKRLLVVDAFTRFADASRRS